MKDRFRQPTTIELIRHDQAATRTTVVAVDSPKLEPHPTLQVFRTSAIPTLFFSWHKHVEHFGVLLETVSGKHNNMYYSVYRIDLKIRRIRWLGCSRLTDVMTHLIAGDQWALRESIVTERCLCFFVFWVCSDSSPGD